MKDILRPYAILATNDEVVMKLKILLLIFRGIGIRSSTKATICGEQARSEYVVARGGCVASADLCGEQEKREGIADGSERQELGPRSILAQETY